MRNEMWFDIYMTTTTDPASRYEQANASREEAIARAAEYAAKGFTSMATIARRKAAGYKATMTRIARTEGWQ